MQTTEDLLLTRIVFIVITSKNRKSQEYIRAIKMNPYYIPNNLQVMNGLISILKADIQNSHGFLPVC